MNPNLLKNIAAAIYVLFVLVQTFSHPSRRCSSS